MSLHLNETLELPIDRRSLAANLVMLSLPFEFYRGIIGN